METAKNDKRWWHIEEYLTGRKALIVWKRTRINWYKCETRFSFKWFNSVDMFYFHVCLFFRVFEFHYYHR